MRVGRFNSDSTGLGERDVRRRGRVRRLRTFRTGRRERDLRRRGRVDLERAWRGRGDSPCASGWLWRGDGLGRMRRAGQYADSHHLDGAGVGCC